MNSRRSFFAAAAVATAMLCAGVSAQTTDVYFVGNSFTSTYDVPTIFKTLSAAGGHTVLTGSDIIGGSELAEHWATGVATNAIMNGHYDYVVLQEGSSVSYTPSIETNFNIYAPLYNGIITNSGAQTVLYMTWVREDQLTYLTNSIAIYRNMGAQLGCMISPVAEAWRRVMQQKPSLDLFSEDRHHPNQLGAYLSACNFYGTIFHESPEGLPMHTVGGLVLNSADAALLQRIAWDAIQFVSYTNPPVITSMTVDQAVRTNNVPFTFSATATDNGSIADYLWNFGDGTTTNGAALTTVNHAYATDGVFPVTVKVTDNSGETERTGLYATLDTTGPQISSITATRTMLTVRFNQDIRQAGAEVPANYAVSGGISVISATMTASNTVRLEVSSLPAGVEYTLTVNNLYSALGMQILPDTSGTFMYVDGSNMHLRFDFGSTNYPTAGNWNNVTSSLVGLVITNAIDIYGVPRNIDLRFLQPPVSLPAMSTGPIASNLYPSTAQRDCFYSSRWFSYQIEGADPTSEYRITFFASKSAASRETLYTIGTNSVVLDCAYNTNRTAVIEGVKSDVDGKIVFTINTNAVNSSGFCYLSVLEIEDTTPNTATLIESSAGSLDVIEGMTNSFNLRLGGQPSGSVTVSVNHVSGEAHVQVLPESSFVYFNTNNWDQWQPVYVEALSDVDTVSGVAAVECADLAGNYLSTTVTVTQVDTTVAAPVAGFNASPLSGPFPLDVTFTDTSTGSITNRLWDFGDGTTTNTAATSLVHTYVSAGTRTVMLVVSGPAGSSTNTQTNLISVTAPVPPAAEFSASVTDGTAPLAVTFTDSSTGNITSRFWDFGDGTTTNITVAGISHTYAAAGTNTVTLIVSGPAGVSTNVQSDLIRVTASGATGSQLVNLNLSASFDYDAFTTGVEMQYASNNLLTVTSQIGDHGVNYTSTRSTGGSVAHMVNPDGSLIGIAPDGVVADGKYLLANGLATKWGTGTGSAKVNNAVGRPFYTGDTALTKTATITLAVADQKKYSNFNILVNGNRYGTRSGVTESALLEVKYVGDATWYTVWSESQDITSGAAGGVFGGPLYLGDAANLHCSAAWTSVLITDRGYAKKGSGTYTVAGSGSSYMWELTNPVVLDSTRILEGFRMTATCSQAARYNDFILYAASATAVDAGGAVGGTDDDNDGIPNDWEQQYFSGATNANPNALAANGINTLMETYIAGLNPTNAQSVFRLSASENLLQWNAVSGRVYSVYGTTNLLSGFQPLETNILWPQNSWTNLVPRQDDEFYRLEVQLAP